MSEDETVKADTAELVERLRAEVAAVQGEAVAWGVDTYGDLPRTLALLNGAADAISSLQDELKRVNALLTASVDDYNTALEEVKRLREALAHLLDIAENFLHRFNVHDLPEDDAQQWQALEREISLARRALTQ